ncbi:single-stranded-DNA-specific exonuclease RecJ [Flavobacteriaceae bacterium 14752]|uniref:single-stranded-DNA-specific exonuclease RecJ n=1 Tax=Mesohalobacter salilacus TaxID=2491711 RepID=UPI000F62D985|nr:single-stranded-DNA-specific exonuclease RecJ [Flavobacteriaceae bacterium 14752]
MIWTQKALPETSDVDSLVECLKASRPIASLLVQRGIKTFDEAKAFFRPDLSHLHDPFLMKDMDKAVNRINQAIQNHENILVYGDYDVDGTTSVALVYSYLKDIHNSTLAYIPDRYKEGYGLSKTGIDYAKSKNASLIICLDCGIKAIDKVEYANRLGVDIIICDHHRPGKNIPDAIAVLDPKQDDCHYPYDELCGCGIGFKLLQALHQKANKNFKMLIPYLDLVATAIGSDIVPITGENRILAYHGLHVLNQNPRPGFKAIMNIAKKDQFSITDVVFIIGPRINAAGRMEHGLHAVNLLTETNLSEAQEKAKTINDFNLERRDTDKMITQEALKQIKALKEEDRKTTVVYHESWHKGVIGIVASRLTETYYRPTLVFTKSGEYLAASARSVYGFDIYNALEASSELIEQFGGHKYAAGLTIKEENYDVFKQKFDDVVSEQIEDHQLIKKQIYDTELELKDITPKFYRILKQFAPFGPGNMRPVFRFNGLQDTGFAKGVGKEKEHLKCKLFKDKDPFKIDGIGFNLGQKLKHLDQKSKIDVLATIDENEWNNQVSLQLKIKDLKPHMLNA